MKSPAAAKQLLIDYVACTQRLLALAKEVRQLNAPDANASLEQILTDLSVVGKAINATLQKKNIRQR